MAKKKTASKKDVSPTFEDSIGKIRDIVARLEGGEVSLGDSLEHYEQGIAELKRCQEILDAAEQRISVLSGFDADGNPVTEVLPEMELRTGAGRQTAPSSRPAEQKPVKKRLASKKRDSGESDGQNTGNDVDDVGGLF